MGMTDRQYEDRQKSHLRELQDIKEEIKLKTEKFAPDLKIEKLERAISDLEEFLKRP